MRDLMKRLERLEQATAPETPHTIIVHFVESADDVPEGIFKSFDPSETVARQPGETREHFESRAIAHFRAKQPAGALVLYAD
jgi:hypothetical protein